MEAPSEMRDAEGSALLVSSRGRVVCLEGHSLSRSMLTSAWICDGCSRRSRTSEMQRFRCHECNYDLCGDCVSETFGANALSITFGGEAPRMDTSSDRSMVARVATSLSCGSSVADGDGRDAVNRALAGGIAGFLRRTGRDVKSPSQSSATVGRAIPPSTVREVG